MVTLEKFKYSLEYQRDEMTTKIRLMRHHLGTLVKNRLGPKKGFWGKVKYEAARFLKARIYGWEHVTQTSNRIMSLNTETTIVELVDDKTDGKTNIDFVCESSCPYVADCGSGKSPLPSMRERSRSFYPLFIELVGEGNQGNKRLKNPFPSGEYSLGDLVEKARPYFGR